MAGEAADTRNPVKTEGSPALGLVARETNASEVATTILRADQHGFHTIVFPDCELSDESVVFARQLGATVVDPKSPLKRGSIKDRLKEAALSAEFDGLIYGHTGSVHIDYARSRKQFYETSTDLVEAVSSDGASENLLLVGIPAYNEGETIGEIVREVQAIADEVIVVDDGSTDETAIRARDAGATVISQSTNRGYGSALKAIFGYAKTVDAAELVVLDGDGQHDASNVPEMIRYRRENDLDVVIGSRFSDDATGNVPLLRRLGIALVNLLTNLVLLPYFTQDWLSDTQSGIRVYNERAIDVLASAPQISDGMESSLDTLLYCVRAGLDIGEIGVNVNYDVAEPNTHNPIRHGGRLVRHIIRIVENEHPITLLGVPGLVVLSVGLGFGYWTLIDYLRTPDFALGLAITATFFTVTGVFTVFTAIILHALKENARSIGIQDTYR